jgi:curved DNA-binding protein CbpA
MSRRSPWEILGVEEGAPDETVRRAFRWRVKQTHPDAGGDEAEFEAVIRAYRIVSHRGARRDDVDRGADRAADRPRPARAATPPRTPAPAGGATTGEERPARSDFSTILDGEMFRVRRAGRGGAVRSAG